MPNQVRYCTGPPQRTAAECPKKSISLSSSENKPWTPGMTSLRERFESRGTVLKNSLHAMSFSEPSPVTQTDSCLRLPAPSPEPCRSESAIDKIYGGIYDYLTPERRHCPHPAMSSDNLSQKNPGQDLLPVLPLPFPNRRIDHG